MTTVLRVKHPGSAGGGRSRRVKIPGDPYGKTKRDYAFNLVTTGVVDLVKLDLRLVKLVAALLVGFEGTGEDPGKLNRGKFDDRLREFLKAEGRLLRAPARPEAPVVRNLALVASALGLYGADVQVLQFAVACRDKDMQELVAEVVPYTRRSLVTLVATATDQPDDMVARSLGPAGRLRETGLLSVKRGGKAVDDHLEVDDRLVAALLDEELDTDSLRRRFLPVAPATTLVRDDYAHLAAEVALAGKILAGALRQSRAGVNVLLHGPSGTGKSELARLLAQELHVPLFVAGTADEEGGPPSASERLTSLQLGNQMIEESQGILLFDEWEDLSSSKTLSQREGLFGRYEKRMSKLWFNSLLENNRVPTIWISNDVSDVDPAFLRRFTFIVEVGALTASQQRRVWMKHLAAAYDALSTKDVDRLVQRFAVSPAQIGGAVATVRLALDGNVDRHTLQAVLEPAERVLGGRTARTNDGGSATRYRPEVVNAPVDLEGIAGKLASWRKGHGPGITLCLYGPSGTGKSAYVRYLAQQMGRPLIVQRASNLLSCWVGETEQKISRAFEQASKDNAVLLFDEVDSFLADRRQAAHSWEATLTDEFLQQLEATSGVVACTTNLFHDLDQAVLRRFTFKIPFLFMRPEQALVLFQQTMEDLGGTGELDPGELGRFTTLTPGDFAAASRRLQSLGVTPTAAELVGELKAEVNVKTGSPMRVGF